MNSFSPIQQKSGERNISKSETIGLIFTSYIYRYKQILDTKYQEECDLHIHISPNLTEICKQEHYIYMQQTPGVKIFSDRFSFA